MAVNYVLKNDISTDVFTSNRAYGSKLGDDFGLVGSIDHAPISRICLYIGREGFGKMLVEKSDGSMLTVGATEAPRTEDWSFEQGERFLEIRMHVKESMLAGIYLRTDKKTVSAYLDGYQPTNPHTIPVGAGECVGVFGNAGMRLESLGFAMLQKQSSRK